MGESRVRERPARRLPEWFQAAALTTAALILWAAAVANFWVTLKDGDPAVITGMATTVTMLTVVAWQRQGRREREQRREDAHLGTIEMLTRPAAASLTGPQTALRRVK